MAAKTQVHELHTYSRLTSFDELDSELNILEMPYIPKAKSKFNWENWDAINPIKMKNPIGGIYIISWRKSAKLPLKKNTSFLLQSPKGSPNVKLTVSQKHINKLSYQTGQITLYVGKSTNIFRRLKHHLQINSDKYDEDRSSSQHKFRHRLEKLLGKRVGYSKIIPENISIEYIVEPDTVTRFFMEQDIITLLQPLFNIDIER